MATPLGTEVKNIFLKKKTKDVTLDGRQEKDIEIDCNHLPGDSTIKEFTRENPTEDEGAEV